MKLQGYVPYLGAQRPIVKNDKFVFTKDGQEKVFVVLSVQRKNLICRTEGIKDKFEMWFTTWDQADGLPRLQGGGELQLYVLSGDVNDPPAPVIKRTKPAPGDSKIAKCRALFAANSALSKEQIIALFISEAKCTPQGAVTYYITCRKGA